MDPKCNKTVDISIVIPTYNERENLPVLLERLRLVLGSNNKWSYEIIVVDDDSPDGTGEYARELAKTKYPELKVIVRKGVKGLASAIIEGMKNSCGRYIIVMDADLQHPPETIPAMYDVALRQKADIVIASRYVDGGGVEGWSKTRLMISKGASLLAHLLVPETRGISDIVSGFFLVKRDFIQGRLDSLKPRGYKVLLDIIGRLKPRRVVEVPYIFHRRVKGKSKLGFKTLIDYVIHILELNEWRIIKNAIVGVIGIVVLWSILYITSDIMDLNVFLAYLIALESSIINNFSWNDIWVFKGRGNSEALYKRLAKYHLAVLMGAISNYIVFATLHGFLGLEKYFASLLGILTGFITNYLFSEHIVWRYRKPGHRKVDK